MILACSNIKKSYGENNILNNITFNINEKEKVAIVGVNGAGKSTLFKIITGEINSDGGEVIMPKDTTIGYLSQVLDIDEENTLFEELLIVYKSVIDMEERLRNIEIELQGAKDDNLTNLADEHHKISTYLLENNCFDYNSRITGILKGLGFKEDEFYNPIKMFSGGQKTRLALGKILLREPDVLLLDEPTNHLDIKSIQWLEGYLKNYTKAVLIISHDRYFLDKVTTKIIELENNQINIYIGSYTKYSQEKIILRENMLKKYINQQKEIKKQEDAIQKLRSFNREKSIKRAESKEKSLNKMEKINAPNSLPKNMTISLSPKKESGADVLFLENVSKSYDRELFKNVYIDIKKGDKIALIGKNGIGKTTLIKMIMGQTKADSGIIKLGSNVIIGYYDQEQSNLNDNKTIFEEISDAFPTLKNEEIRKTLAVFVFTGDDVFKKISMLSGGEKGRVALAKIMLSRANFLILDEPTNHLDMMSKEILEDAICSYTGTCLYISHDRYFINKTANKVIELTNIGTSLYLGGYDYYLEKIQMAEEQKIEKIETATKLDWKEKKQKQSEDRKRTRDIEKMEKKIDEIEKKIEELDKELLKEEVYTDIPKTTKIYEQKISLEEELANMYEKWEDTM